MTQPDGSDPTPGDTEIHRTGGEYAKLERDKLERAALLREVTSVFAHQISQPLASIAVSGQAALQWLGRPVPEIGEAVQSLKKILQNKDRAAETLGEFRSAVNALAPARPARPERVDFALVLRSARSAVAEALLASGAELEIDAALGTARVRLSAIELEIVFVQLLRNAIAAVATTEDRVLIVRRLEGQECAILDFTDTGSGVADGDKGRVFDLFFTTRPGAEGLGLNVGRSIIAGAGGRLALVNTGPNGSTFRIELPRATDDDVSAA